MILIFALLSRSNNEQEQVYSPFQISFAVTRACVSSLGRSFQPLGLLYYGRRFKYYSDKFQKSKYALPRFNKQTTIVSPTILVPHTAAQGKPCSTGCTPSPCCNLSKSHDLKLTSSPHAFSGPTPSLPLEISLLLKRHLVMKESPCTLIWCKSSNVSSEQRMSWPLVGAIKHEPVHAF